MTSNYDIYFNEEAFTDINPLFVGRQECEPNHSYGPRICPYTIIHYVLKGKGILEQNGKIYKISKGQLFIIFADEIAKYTADNKEPWDYMWIAYDGLYLKKLKEANSKIITINEPIFEELLGLFLNGQCDKYFIASVLYRLHSLYAKKNISSESHNYPKEVKKIIDLKYMQSISVEGIARTLNIDKRYMSRIFKKKYGKTVIEYIIDTRMNKACKMLQLGYSVANTASLVGYSDNFNFSKMFTKKFGISPREYKCSHRQSDLQ